MNPRGLFTFTFALLAFVISGCFYDVEEELYSDLECQTQNVTYSADILPVLQENCYVCHGLSISSGGVTLEGHSNVKTFADNGRLLGAIRHDPGFSPMPQNQPQLVQCTIEKFEAWVAAGAPEN
jgi:hypothetical protein